MIWQPNECPSPCRNLSFLLLFFVHFSNLLLLTFVFSVSLQYPLVLCIHSVCFSPSLSSLNFLFLIFMWQSTGCSSYRLHQRKRTFFYISSAAAHNKFKRLTRADNHCMSSWLHHKSIHISMGKYIQSILNCFLQHHVSFSEINTNMYWKRIHIMKSWLWIYTFSQFCPCYFTPLHPLLQLHLYSTLCICA